MKVLAIVVDASMPLSPHCRGSPIFRREGSRFAYIPYSTCKRRAVVCRNVMHGVRLCSTMVARWSRAH